MDAVESWGGKLQATTGEKDRTRTTAINSAAGPGIRPQTPKLQTNPQKCLVRVFFRMY